MDYIIHIFKIGVIFLGSLLFVLVLCAIIIFYDMHKPVSNVSNKNKKKKKKKNKKKKKATSHYTGSHFDFYDDDYGEDDDDCGGSDDCDYDGGSWDGGDGE